MGGVATGGPVMGSEPDRQHRGRRDGPAGDRPGDVVVPEEGVPVLHRRTGRPDVAPLDRELTGLLVLGHTDEGADLGHVSAAAVTPRPPAGAARRSASGSTPAASRSSSVSVTAGSRTITGADTGGMPARTAPTWQKERPSVSDRLDHGPARGELGIVGDLRHGLDRGHAGVVAREGGHPRVAVAPGEGGGEGGPHLVLGVVVVLAVGPLLAAERPAEVGEELGLDGRHRQPPSVGRPVGVVAGVAPGQHVVSGARLGPGGQVLVDGQGHEPQGPVGHGHVEEGALTGELTGEQRGRDGQCRVHAAGGRVGDGGAGDRRAPVGTGAAGGQVAGDGQVVEVVTGPAGPGPALAVAGLVEQ